MLERKLRLISKNKYCCTHITLGPPTPHCTVQQQYSLRVQPTYTYTVRYRLYSVYSTVPYCQRCHLRQEFVLGRFYTFRARCPFVYGCCITRIQPTLYFLGASSLLGHTPAVQYKNFIPTSVQYSPKDATQAEE